jgi:hypothetical protein
MSQRSMFFDSTGGDRIYTSDAWAQIISRIAGDGVVYDWPNGLIVTPANPASMNIRVDLGAAFIQGRFFEVYSALEVLSVGAAHTTLSRIDRVVVRLDFSARSITLAVKAGTAAVTPTAPTMQRDTSRWELSLARIAIAPNQSSISAGNITDERIDGTVCGRSDLVLQTAHQRATGNVHGTTAAQVGALSDIALAGPAGSNFVKSVVGTVATLTFNAATQALAGLFSAADKLKLDSATPNNVGNALVQRDANGDATFRIVTVGNGVTGDGLRIGNDSILYDIDVANAAGLRGTSNPATGDLYMGTSRFRVWHDGWIDETKIVNIIGGKTPTRFETTVQIANNNSMDIYHGLGGRPKYLNGYWGSLGADGGQPRHPISDNDITDFYDGTSRLLNHVFYQFVDPSFVRVYNRSGGVVNVAIFASL